MKKYKHLTQNDRDRIELLLKQRFKQKEIAKTLGYSFSTISREIKRNKIKKTDTYQSSFAHLKQTIRRRNSKYQGKKIREDKELLKYIVKRLEKGWSPDIISGRMKLEERSFYVNKNSIYRWLYSPHGGRYCKHLLCQRDHRRKRRKRKKREMIPNRVGIEKRPPLEGIGHMEGDTIVSPRYGSKYALTVLKDKASRKVGIEKIRSLKPDEFNKGVLKIKKRMGSFKTLTLDNGVENKYHEKLHIPTYFCNPYSSWEKGQVENVNGIIRRFIPKKKDIALYSKRYIRSIERWLNNVPRKSLNYKTPNEVFYGKIVESKQKAQSEKIALEV